MLTVVQNDSNSAADDSSAGGRSLIDEIVREGAPRMLAAALQAEVADYIDRFSGEVDENGHRLVVRNGYHAERDVLTAAGAVNVKAPRVNDKRIDPDTVERQRFSSSILPAWVRKSPQMNEVLPLLYLHGLSTSDFGPALEQFLGSGAGLSAASITRLTTQWQNEAKTFQNRDLSGTDFVYLWVDGIYLKVRIEQEKLCLLVMIGVRADAEKSSSPSSTGTASPPSRGRICCAVVAGTAWPRLSSRSVTALSGFGGHCGRCSPKPVSSGAGFTSNPMFFLRYRSRRIRVRSRR